MYMYLQNMLFIIYTEEVLFIRKACNRMFPHYGMIDNDVDT